MRRLSRHHGLALALWLVLTAAGCVLLARAELEKLRDAFETDARIAHRLLSQRAVQHDAVLATLALLQPSAAAGAEQRLPALYPQIVSVQRRDGGVPIKVGNETIGAVGVGGAPGGHLDEQCAVAALDLVKEQLK